MRARSAVRYQSAAIALEYICGSLRDHIGSARIGTSDAIATTLLNSTEDDETGKSSIAECSSTLTEPGRCVG